MDVTASLTSGLSGKRPLALAGIGLIDLAEIKEHPA